MQNVRIEAKSEQHVSLSSKFLLHSYVFDASFDTKAAAPAELSRPSKLSATEAMHCRSSAQRESTCTTTSCTSETCFTETKLRLLYLARSTACCTFLLSQSSTKSCIRYTNTELLYDHTYRRHTTQLLKVT